MVRPHQKTAPHGLIDAQEVSERQDNNGWETRKVASAQASQEEGEGSGEEGVKQAEAWGAGPAPS